MLWIRGMAQKAINIAANWASEQELQFGGKKTEIVLFTHKRNPDLGSLAINGPKLELSKEARLLGVTLDSKLTWKPHIAPITRKATTALMQCRKIVGKTWGIKPSMMKWIYTAMIRPITSYPCVSWAGGLNKKYLVRKLTKVLRLACLMISSAFPGTPTGALEIVLDITLIEKFLLAEAAEVESSRTHFEVLGLEGQVLGLEASSPRKLACPRLEDSTIFWIVKILWSAWKVFWKTFFCGDRLKNFCEDLYFIFWRSPEKFLGRPFFFVGDCLKNFCEDLFFVSFFVLEIAWKIFVKTFCALGPWPRAFLSLA